ncbi:hypothetical protein OAT16_03980 [Prolixibacteraceae bacterium]|nr:hypothetical protein [Prolixibacteraceae bacterium]
MDGLGTDYGQIRCGLSWDIVQFKPKGGIGLSDVIQITDDNWEQHNSN